MRARSAPRAGRLKLAPKGAAPRGGRMQSKRQWRFAFATHQAWAHAAATRGRYRFLPERKG